jgi:cell shape-determining protein MreC
MVTNYRQERLVKQKRQKLYGVLFIVCIIFALGRKPIFTFIGRVSHYIGIPIWKVENSLIDSLEYTSEIVKPKSVLVAELIELKRNQFSYSDREAIIEALKIENKGLKESQNRIIDDKNVLARVLSRPPLQVYDTLVIDVGSSDGVTLLSDVYSKNDYVVGVITRVFKNTSVVTLKSAPGEVHQIMVPNIIENSSEHSSTSKNSLLHSISFTGLGGGGFKAQIPKHLNIATNTPMILSSINSEVIGIITGESTDDSNSLKDVFGSLPFSINSIDWVTVKIKEIQN